MTQEQFAQLAGVSRRTQTSYEAGERIPREKYWRKLAAAGIDISAVRTHSDASAGGPETASVRDQAIEFTGNGKSVGSAAAELAPPPPAAHQPPTAYPVEPCSTGEPVDIEHLREIYLDIEAMAEAMGERPRMGRPSAQAKWDALWILYREERAGAKIDADRIVRALLARASAP